MIIYTNQKSKKRKPTAKERQLAAEWELIKAKHATKPVVTKKKSDKLSIAVTVTYRKNDIPSLDTGYHNTYRKPDKFYTGDKMKGIGTLHKSNAVPIFTDEEAKDQASMRR